MNISAAVDFTLDSQFDHGAFAAYLIDGNRHQWLDLQTQAYATAFLAEVGVHQRNRTLLTEDVSAAVNWTIDAQLENGGWCYADAPGNTPSIPNEYAQVDADALYAHASAASTQTAVFGTERDEHSGAYDIAYTLETDALPGTYDLTVHWVDTDGTTQTGTVTVTVVIE